MCIKTAVFQSQIILKKDMADNELPEKINGKDVVASSGKIYFAFNFFKSDSSMGIGDGFDNGQGYEKIFGLLDKNTNVLLKFKLIALVKECGEIRTTVFASSQSKKATIDFKLIYLSEEPIDCRINLEIGAPKEKILNNMSFFNQIFNTYPESRKYIMLSIDVCWHLAEQKFSWLNQLVTQKFNDNFSSDFVIKCQEKEYYVHQFILKERGDYFNGIFRNDCQESRNQELIIDDFKPEVVEILVRYLYNGAFQASALLLQNVGDVMAIADKYNFTELFETLDSCFAELITLSFKLIKFESIENIIKVFEKVSAQKALFAFTHWRINCDVDVISDYQWSTLIENYPNFSSMFAKTVGTKSWESWIQLHEVWSLCPLDCKKDLAIIVEPLTETKGNFKTFV